MGKRRKMSSTKQKEPVVTAIKYDVVEADLIDWLRKTFGDQASCEVGPLISLLPCMLSHPQALPSCGLNFRIRLLKAGVHNLMNGIGKLICFYDSSRMRKLGRVSRDISKLLRRGRLLRLVALFDF
jgi:hypothetical protein